MRNQWKSYTANALASNMVRACDKLWRTLILRRSKGACAIRGADKPKVPGGILWIQAAHIIGRGYWFLRWHPKNGLGVCQECHVDHKIVEFLLAADPARLAWLRSMKNKNIPQRAVDLQQTYNKLLPQALGF